MTTRRSALFRLFAWHERSPSVVSGLLFGAASGVLWGVAARLWMRLISDDPEFSLGGTIFIVLAFAVLGMLAGCARAARGAGWRGGRLVIVRILAFLAVVPMATGAGALLVVGIVLPGALALGQRRWWSPLRVLLGLATTIATAGIAYIFVREKTIFLAPVTTVRIMSREGWPFENASTASPAGRISCRTRTMASKLPPTRT